MAKSHRFFSIHRQGMIRAGVCTPIATAGDPAANAEATIALARQGDAEGADLLLFPELNVTSYAIDDLHLQDAILDATEAGNRGDRRGERQAQAGAAGRRGAAAERARL